MCGSGNNNWEKMRVKVQFQGASVNGKLAARVWTNLNSAANDESFGIDNVVVQKLSTSETDKFDGTDFRDW